MKDTIDGINEPAWDRAMRGPRERKVYVLMWNDDPHVSGNLAEGLCVRQRAMFATCTIKQDAIRQARKLKAKVYAIPYPGQGWDCPTIRAVFPILFDGTL